MDHERPTWRIRIRTLIFLVIITALGAALVVEHTKRGEAERLAQVRLAEAEAEARRAAAEAQAALAEAQQAQAQAETARVEAQLRKALEEAKDSGRRGK
jgi:hypothetical protein